MEKDPKQVLINLMAGAVLADHMGDMASDIEEAAKQIGIVVPDDFVSTGGDSCGMDTPLERLSEYLVTYNDAETVWGTPLFDEDD